MLATKRSAIALARGARAGVSMMLTSMAVKTASNVAVNLASRSRIKNRKRRPASSQVHAQVAGELGQPGTGGVRGDAEDVYAVACSMTKKKTYSRCRVMVSRWNNSQARIPWAGARRNSVHEGPARRVRG